MAKTPLKIACVGDSITHGYAAHLQELMPEAEVHNFGFPGWTSASIARKAKSLHLGRYDFVLILVGANDWKVRGHSLAKTIAKVREIRRHNKHSIVLTYPWVWSPERREQTVWMRNLTLKLLRYFPASVPFMNWRPDEMLSPDGIHPNSYGYAWMANQIRKELNAR